MFLFTKNFWRTFAIALIVMATHPALDYTNSYGLRPFLPFSGTWYYGDILFIIDPYIDAVLLTGLLAGYYFKNIRRAAAWISILLMCLYIGTRVELRNQAQARLRNMTQELQSRDSRLNIRKSAVLPQMLDPRIWNGIIETDDVVMAENVGAFRSSLRRIDSDPVIMRKERPSAITERAANAPSAAVLLRFARFPVMRVERAGPRCGPSSCGWRAGCRCSGRRSR
jgi:inner membrane protein